MPRRQEAGAGGAWGDPATFWVTIQMEHQSPKEGTCCKMAARSLPGRALKPIYHQTSALQDGRRQSENMHEMLLAELMAQSWAPSRGSGSAPPSQKGDNPRLQKEVKCCQRADCPPTAHRCVNLYPRCRGWHTVGA